MKALFSKEPSRRRVVFRRGQFSHYLALMGIVLLVSLPRAGFADLHGSARYIGSTTQTDPGGTRSFDQQYMLNFNRAFLPYLQGRASLSYHDLLAYQNFTDNAWHGELSPSADLSWNNPFFATGGNYRYRQVRDYVVTNNSLNRGAGFFFRTKFVSLPQSTVQYDWDRTLNHSGLWSFDTEQRRFQYSNRYTLSHGGYYYHFTQSRFRNFSTQSEQRQFQHVFRLDFSQGLIRNKLRFSTNYLFNYTRNEEESGSAAQPLTQIPLAQGLYSQDPTPEFGALDTLSSLIDGELTSPTTPTINLGGVNTLQNLGFDLVFSRDVNVIYVLTDRPSGAAVTWAVYFSADNLEWTPLSTPATFLYNPSYDRYEITFAPVAARYFKVLNSGVNSEPEVYVTEIQAWLSSNLATPPTNKSENHRVNLNASYQMHRYWKLALDGVFGSLYENATGQERQDVNLAGALTYRPSTQFSSVARYQRGKTEYTSGVIAAQETEMYSLVFLANPLPTLETSLSGSHRNSYENSLESQRVTSSLLHLSALLIPGLSAIAEVSFSHDVRPTTDLITNTSSYRLSTDAELYQNFTIIANYSQDRYTHNQPNPIAHREAAELRFNYRPVLTLFLQGGVEYGREGDQDNYAHDYSLSWTMTEKLASSASARFQVNSNTNRTDTWNLQTNYNLSNRTNLYAAYSTNRIRELTSQSTTTLQIGLNTSF